MPRYWCCIFCISTLNDVSSRENKNAELVHRLISVPHSSHYSRRTIFCMFKSKAVSEMECGENVKNLSVACFQYGAFSVSQMRYFWQKFLHKLLELLRNQP